MPFPTRSALIRRLLARFARATLTAASRITTSTYPGLYIAVGLLLIFQDQSRTSSEAFDVARMLVPIQGWGIAFLAVGLVELIALGFLLAAEPTAARGRWIYIKALQAGAGLATFWTVVMAAAAYRSDQVSYTSAAWLVAIVAFHIASARSLAKAEGKPR